jgi:hypothetical protein
MVSVKSLQVRGLSYIPDLRLYPTWLLMVTGENTMITLLCYLAQRYVRRLGATEFLEWRS